MAIAPAVCLQASERAWTRSEILAIADAEVKHLGSNVEQMTVAIDHQNASWRQSHGKALNQDSAIRGRPYWAVFYENLIDPMAPEVVVFIDRETGRVLKTEASPWK